MLAKGSGAFGFIPIVMSAAAITIVLSHLAFVGTAPQTDEGQKLICGSCSRRVKSRSWRSSP